MLPRTAAVLLFAFAIVLSARAQTPEDLDTLSRDAALIFSGRVEAVAHLAPAAAGDLGVVRVVFRVSRGYRGAADGQSLTIVEWDALWTSGERYRVGEQFLLFLYAPSGELGLTSTVTGQRGRLKLSDAEPLLAELERRRAAEQPPPPSPHEPQKPPRPRRPSVPRPRAAEAQ